MIGFLLATLAILQLPALALEPLTHVFGTTPAARVHTYRVTNTQDQPIAVRIRMTTRDQTPDGAEQREDAGNQWLVFPARLTLAPGQSQAVRVQYTGPSGTQREKAFRIIAEQLPIDMSGGEQRSGINVLFRYEGSVYVRTGRFAPQVSLADAQRLHHEGELRLLVRFENQGMTHAILGDLVIRVELRNANNQKIDELVFEGEQLPILAGRNLLAGRALEQLLPLPETWSEGVIDVQYTVDILD